MIFFFLNGIPNVREAAQEGKPAPEGDAQHLKVISPKLHLTQEQCCSQAPGAGARCSARSKGSLQLLSVGVAG